MKTFPKAGVCRALVFYGSWMPRRCSESLLPAAICGEQQKYKKILIFTL